MKAVKPKAMKAAMKNAHAMKATQLKAYSMNAMGQILKEPTRRPKMSWPPLASAPSVTKRRKG